MKKYDKKPFPWRCSNCGEKSIYEAAVDYATRRHHDGHEYIVHIAGLKTPKCTACGVANPDREALDTITAAFIRQINLLTSEQIQEHRLKAKLSQHELAAALGVEDFVVEQLETGGQIQPRTLDNLMRLCFGLPQAREILTSQQISTLPRNPDAQAPLAKIAERPMT